jgi:c-di-GMP-binding flagellar brake protein YcgR
MTQTPGHQGSEKEERRRFIRVNIYAITRYFCPLRDMEVGVQTRISDISEGGALLVTFMEGVPVGVDVKMSFVMPGKANRVVSVEGVARHTGVLEKELYRSGVEFLKIRKKDLLAIREYVASKTKGS